MKARFDTHFAHEAIGWPQSGQTRIAVGETHGGSRIFCATPKGSNVFLSLARGLTPTAIHVLPLRGNEAPRGTCANHHRAKARW